MPTLPPSKAERSERFSLLTALELGTLLLVSRLLVLSVAALSRLCIPPGPCPAMYMNHSWLERFKVWDANWYLGVARYGYDYHPTGASRIGFYPLYPMLIRTLSFTGLDPVLSGYLVSHLALAGACVLCWRLALLEFGSGATAHRAVVFLLFCPGAVWFGMIYSESLFLLTMLGCMLAARQKRWLLAGAWGYASALSRTPGVLLAGFLLLEAFQQWRESRPAPPQDETSRRPTLGGYARQFWKPLCAVACPVLGQLSFMAYQQIAFGDWRAQQKTVANGWAVKGIRLPWVNLADYWHRSDWFHTVLSDSLLCAVLVLGVASFFVLKRASYAGLIFALVVLYASSTNIDGLPRYLSTTVPIYLVLARLAADSPTFHSTILVFSTALLTLVTTLLANGYIIG